MNTNNNSSTLTAPKNQSTSKCDRTPLSLVLMKSFNESNKPTQEQKNSIAQIYVEQALIYYQKNNWHRAIFACKNALELDANTAEAYEILGDILCGQNKEAEALGIYAKALTINPNLATVYAKLGALHVERNNWQKALDYYQQAVILDPNLAETHRNLARIWEELGDNNKALEYFCRAVDLDPQTLDSEDYFNFGKELYQEGKIKEASILFIHGIELNPLAKRELAQLVQMLEKLEEWQQAVVYYHQLMSLLQKSDRSYSSSCEPEDSCYSTLSLHKKPISKLLSSSKYSFSNKVIAKNTQTNIPCLPQNTTRKLLPSVESKPIERDSTTINLSLPNTTEAFATRPDSALSWNNLGSIYAQKKQWTKAVSCYQEALQLDSSFVKSYRNLARVYNNIGEQLKAALYWYESFRLEPDLVKPLEYFSLAQKLIEYQQNDKAIACLRRTIELDPDFNLARLTLDRLLESNVS